MAPTSFASDAASAHALRQRHAREMEEPKREHNDLLLDALRTRNARALTTATKAVRRELCLLVHPDKASRYASARLMGEAVMQRLGELAHPPRGLRLAEALLGLQPLEELALRRVLHHEVHALLVVEVGVQPHHARVLAFL